MASAIDAVARMRDFCDEEHPEDSHAAWLQAQVKNYLENASAGLSLEAAVGVATPKGSRPWWRQEERDKSTKALRRLLDLYPQAGIEDRISSIARDVDLYRQGRWQHARQQADVVYQDPKLNAIHELLVLTDGAPPISRRSAKRLMGTSSAISCPKNDGPMAINEIRKVGSDAD